MVKHTSKPLPSTSKKALASKTISKAKIVLPTYKDVVSAAKRLHGVAQKTPVMRSSTLNKELGAEVFLKCENYQRIGAFKFRGAFNALSQLSSKQRKNGVVTFSSGNHAQAIALSGQILGIKATIFMAKGARASKIEATKGYGGTVIMYDAETEDRAAIAEKMRVEKGMTFISPFDHKDIIAGQGTAAKELFEEVGKLDHLFVCLAGGGLISGCSIVAKKLSPGCQVHGVEPLVDNDG